MSSLDFINLALRTHYALARKNICNLLFGKGITLDCRSAANRAYMINLAQTDSIRALEDNPISFNGGSNLCNQVHCLTAHLVGGNILL